jgi:hypothetical protein
VVRLHWVVQVGQTAVAVTVEQVVLLRVVPAALLVRQLQTLAVLRTRVVLLVLTPQTVLCRVLRTQVAMLRRQAVLVRTVPLEVLVLLQQVRLRVV